MQRKIESVSEMKDFGMRLGERLSGGEVIVLTGDVGAGKTTFVKGLALGMGIDEDVQSPSFTISRLYEAPSGLRLAHYDFYRLNEPGIMRAELSESVSDQTTVTVIEWADAVDDVVPTNSIRISLLALDEDVRQLELVADDETNGKIKDLF